MYEKEYRDGMHQLSFSPDFEARTQARMKASRTPRRRKKWIAAVAALLVVVIGVQVILRPAVGTNGMIWGLRAYAAAQPHYPDYPRQSRLTFLGNYPQERREYQSTIGILEQDYTAAAADFSAKSAALLLSDTGEENRVFSPVNLWFALSMLAEITDNESRQQVLNALGQSDLERARQQAGVLWRTLYQDNGVSGILPANSLWLDQDMDYTQSTVELLAEHYYAGSYQVDMGSRQANQAIQTWLNAQTDGRLEQAVKATTTDPQTVLALFSTLRYYGEWTKKFDASNTYEDIFTQADGTELTCDFMHQLQTYGTCIGVEGYTAARLGTENASVWFILPDEGYSPDDLAADPELWTALTDDAVQERRKVEWSVPKFDVSSSMDLSDALKDLGITDLFDQHRADFSALIQDTDLPITLSSTRQSARVEADEDGIRGVSYVELMGAGSAMPPDEICVMDLDRPFLFVITSPVDGVPLFTGVVHNPLG